jgi:hypothetical protein
MTDESISVTCPQCRYHTTWSPPDDFPPALDMFNRCPVVTALLNDHPVEREQIGGDPRHCYVFRNEWVKVVVAKKHEVPHQGE